MHRSSELHGLCRWWQDGSAALFDVQLLINQGLELRPGQSPFNNVTVVFFVTPGGSDHEGWRGADIVQFGFRKIGINECLSFVLLHAGMKA